MFKPLQVLEESLLHGLALVAPLDSEQIPRCEARRPLRATETHRGQDREVQRDPHGITRTT
jgi:hypothetical protein